MDGDGGPSRPTKTALADILVTGLGSLVRASHSPNSAEADPVAEYLVAESPFADRDAAEAEVPHADPKTARADLQSAKADLQSTEADLRYAEADPVFDHPSGAIAGAGLRAQTKIHLLTKAFGDFKCLVLAPSFPAIGATCQD
jgi:hypothetical protein